MNEMDGLQPKASADGADRRAELLRGRFGAVAGDAPRRQA